MGARLSRTIRVVAITLVATVLIVAGVVMLVTPGPGLLLIAAGLAVLATEFAWAKELRDRLMAKVRDARSRGQARRRRRRELRRADSSPVHRVDPELPVDMPPPERHHDPHHV